MLQAKTGDLGMWLVSNRSNLFGGPWQSWSVSNLCFRQKFLRQVLQVTGTSWRRKTKRTHLDSSIGNKGYLLPLELLGHFWVTVACFSSSRCLSFHHLQYEAMKTGDVESLVMRLLHWQTNLPLLAARIGTAVSNGLQKERLMER